MVGVDGGDDGLRAVDYAVREAGIRKAELVVAHVIDLSPLLGAPAMMYGADVLKRAGEEAVDAAVRRVRATGFPSDRVRGEVAMGNVGAVLCSMSQEASLVVLGRRDLSGFERLFAGSTCVSVGARAHCPVIVVPPGWAPLDLLTIGVGIDGSARSEPALEWAFEEADARGATLRVIHAWEPHAPFLSDDSEYAEAVSRWALDAELAVAESLAGWQQDYPGVHVERVFKREHPIRALLSESEHLDLLYVGVRGAGGVPGLALGSVARGVLAGASCPVSLVRRGPSSSRRRRREEVGASDRG
ncbi:universal stress protein [Microlunatus panaciterrae]